MKSDEAMMRRMLAAMERNLWLAVDALDEAKNNLDRREPYFLQINLRGVVTMAGRVNRRRKVGERLLRRLNQ